MNPPRRERRRLPLVFGAFYFAQFAVLGIYIPYFPLYLKSLLLTGSQIGLVLALAPISRFLFPAFWGLWADRAGHRRLFILFSLAGSAAAFSLLFWVRRLVPLAGVMLLYGFLLVPAIPLVEGIAQEEAERRAFAYGRIRLWGSLGFIASTMLFGRILDAAPLHWILAGILGISLLNLAPAVALPGGDPPGVHPHRSLRRELSRPGMAAFFASTALMQASHGAYYAYYSLHLDRLGHSRTAIGGFWTLAVAAEVVMMLVSGSLLERFGATRLLPACFGAAILRWLLLSFASAAPLLALGQILHALTFGLFHVSAVGHTHRIFPPALRSSGQSLFSSLTYGLGNLMGYFGSALLVETLGIRGLFAASALPALAALCLCAKLRPEPS
jgi:MFS transporter, PPP family, 3-phenylpropionic acid transporter